MSFAGIIRIGTRRSPLAMVQARIVGEALKAAHEGLDVELVPIITHGDRTPGILAEVGGKGLFTTRLEAALRSGHVNLAVHSAKDLPSAMAEDLAIAAVPPRADPRDALISRGGRRIKDLPAGATVGTSSPRRRVQLLAVRGDLNVMPIRGNLETRIAKVFLQAQNTSISPADAIVLAMAGLERSGLRLQYRDHICPLDVEQFIPAAGQGALAVQTLATCEQICQLVASVDDPPSSQALHAERKVLRELGASCRSCIAVHIAPACGQWRALGMAAEPDGGKCISLEATAGEAAEAGALLGEQFRRRGADKLLRS